MTVLDTNIVIYLFEGRLEDRLDSAGLVVSIITEIELLSHDRLNADAEAGLRSFLSSISVLGVTEEIKERAIAIRRRCQLTVPDAIIAATAMALDAELLSNDAKLAVVPDLRCRSLALKA